jgi:ubiquinone/menaquinone biosynthesis C-methylase UbiE
VQQGDAASLAFPDATFDLATAFETVYFWPGLEKCFKQVFRVLRPGGVFMICNESDGTDPASKKFEGIRLETSLQFRRNEVLHGAGA